MGKKKTPSGDAGEESKAEKLAALKEKHKKELEPMGGEKALDEVVPDTPIVKKLKEIDDKYLALEREFELKMQALDRECQEKQAPLLKKRMEMLAEAPKDGPADAPATPACKGFWLQALKNLPGTDEMIEDWDEPVLEYLKDVRFVVPEDTTAVNRGFKLHFEFAENPYSEPTTLSKDYTSKETNPYIGQIDVVKIDATKIEWKEGKDVTVELTKKKAKGGGAKKAKQKGKTTTEPRHSFFRFFFQSMEEGGEFPSELEGFLEDEDDDDGDEKLSDLMEQDHDIADRIKNNLIPYAVRWYTGEARPESDDEWDDEDEESEEDDDDDDDDDDSEDDEPAPKKGAKKGGAKAKAKGKAGAGGKEEECKQQ